MQRIFGICGYALHDDSKRVLHAEYHRPLDKPMRDRFSRHYADTALLANHPETIKAIDDHDLRHRVVLWKSLYFGSSSAHYVEAKPSTFRLVPKAKRLSELRRDYQLMRDMYLTQPTNFDDILGVLSDLERRINDTHLFSLALFETAPER